MSPTLTKEMRKAIQEQTDAPIEVLDAESNRVYVLVAKEQYDQMCALLADDEFEPREMYPLIAKTAGAAGWNDPLMDEYDNYDEHRTKG